MTSTFDPTRLITKALLKGKENRERFKAKTPKGKFIVVGVDTFSNDDWIYDEIFDDLPSACAFADGKVINTQMLMMHVYNDQGDHQYECGKF